MFGICGHRIEDGREGEDFTSGGSGPQNNNTGCDATLTGDKDIDTVARILFGESTSGAMETYEKMGDVIENRFKLGLKEFGCDVSGVALKLSDADERNNFGYNAAGSNDSLENLTKDQCNSFKIAQYVAKNTVDNANDSCRGSFCDIEVGDGLVLWWRGGKKPSGKGRLTVGDTTFYSYDPQNPTSTGNDLYEKYQNRFSKNVAKGWHCGM